MGNDGRLTPLKLIKDDSWVVLLPNAGKPVIDLFAEAPSLGQGRGLVAQHETKMRALIPSGFLAA